MPVKVTIENLSDRTHKSYSGAYTLAFVMDEIGRGRWVQDPMQNNDGMSLFVAALTALREVASIQGDEIYKVAARMALAEMDKARNAKIIKPQEKTE
jgi:hypothetical protein